MKKALITGVTGQDGAYLSELLLNKGYEVYGIKRRSSLFNTERVDHLYLDPHIKDKRFHLRYGDLADTSNIIKLIQEIKPDEIYNLGAMSHVKVSFEEPEYTSDINGLGVLRVLEAVRLLNLQNTTRIYQASTSELFGMAQEIPQNEKTPFYPRSPYGIAKLYGHWITINYREAYGLYACNGILFNHESPVRGETFVTRKITRGVAKIALGLQERIYIGNLNARRDWGHAKDFVEAMWLMLQQEVPEDFVIATGKASTVRDLVIMAFKVLDIEVAFEGTDKDEIGVIVNCDARWGLNAGQVVVEVDTTYYRPTEVDSLIGDASKAKEKLGWTPKYDLKMMIEEMVKSDLLLFERDIYLTQNGHKIINYHE